mgnify:CR=1 FL=1
MILCVGGSTTLGVRSTRGYPEHIAQQLGGVLVANRGIAGGRLVDVLRQLPSDLLLVGGPAVLLVGLPLHDAQGGGTPPSELGVLLGQVVQWGTAHCSQVVLCTPTPIGAAPLAPVRGFVRASRRWVAKGAQEVRDVAAEYDLPVVAWDDMPPERLVDVAHPGPAGYRWMADRALPVVQQALEAIKGG